MDGVRRGRVWTMAPYWIVMAIVAAVAIVGVFQFRRANALEQEMEGNYVRAFHDTVDYVRDIDVMLKKAMLTNDPRQLANISSEIFMQAASAKASLGQLPLSDAHLDNTSKFLSQVGDFTSYLSGKVIDSGEISDEEYQTLSGLAEYADGLGENLVNMQSQLYDGELSLSRVSRAAAEADDEITFVSSMAKVEKEFQDYPSLVYDGPFSEHIEQMEPAALTGRPEVTAEQAQELAGYFLGSQRAETLTLEGESESGLPVYRFSAQPPADEGRQISAEVTKQNGMMLYFLDNRPVGEETIDAARAGELAAQYLSDMGYSGMTQSYYEKNDGVATINFAWTDQGVIIYSDLIKVKVALDNGEIVGFESKGYIMSHKDRDLPAAKISAEQARAKVNRHLQVGGERLAYIPKESKREVLCYEFKGKFDDKNFLVYVNAITGKEEKILMLIESEDGILTM